MSIGSIIMLRRQDLGLLQTDIVKLLEKDGIHVSKHTVSHWENDKTMPNAQQFIGICHALQINNVLDAFWDVRESEDVFSGLNYIGRERVKEYASLLRSSEEFQLRQPESKKLRMLPLYSLAVSAGTGQFLDGDNYEMVECGIEVPEGSNFGVRVAGDSMEPQFYDGQTIWVRQQRSLMSGEIGIFLYDGDAYLKKLVAENGEVRLHSLNSKYNDIIVSPELPLRVLGKVLS